MEVITFHYFSVTSLNFEYIRILNCLAWRDNPTGRRVIGRCHAQLDKRANRKHQNRITLSVCGGKEKRTALVPSQCTRKPRKASRMRLLNVRTAPFSQSWSNVINMVIVSNSTSHCNLITHYLPALSLITIIFILRLNYIATLHATVDSPALLNLCSLVSEPIECTNSVTAAAPVQSRGEHLH